MIKGLEERDIVLQLIEECAELTHALAKYQRAKDGRNFTPVTTEDALESVVEELADVECVIWVLADAMNIPGHVLDEEIQYKLERWTRRQEGPHEQTETEAEV